MIQIERSYPAPECLEREKEKKTGDYKCGDVLERLKRDFHNKCYLCEYKAPPDINVEHFVPHQGDKEKMFDWNNLFYACGHCNNTKLAKYNTNDQNEILDCTNSEHDVVNWMKYETENFPKLEVKITALKDDRIVKNTVKLLDEIYNGTTPTKRLEAENIRDRLQEELITFQGLILSYRETDNADEREIYLAQIKKHFERISAFTAFKIWFLRERPMLQEMLGVVFSI